MVMYAITVHNQGFTLENVRTAMAHCGRQQKLLA